MKRVRLQIQVLPWEESTSQPSRGARGYEHDIRPWLQPEDADNTLQQLVDNIVHRFGRIYIGRGPLRIKELQDSWGSTLDLSDKVGDVFDDRSPSGDNLTSICKIIRYPPREGELIDPQRFASLLPESAARPQKRPLGSLHNDLLRSVEEKSFNNSNSASKRRRIDRTPTANDRVCSIRADQRPQSRHGSSRKSRDRDSVLQVLDSQASQRKATGDHHASSSEDTRLTNVQRDTTTIPDSPAQQRKNAVIADQERGRCASPELELSIAEASQRPQSHASPSSDSDSDIDATDGRSANKANEPPVDTEVKPILSEDEIVDSARSTQEVFKKPTLPSRVVRPSPAARFKMVNPSISTGIADPIESDGASFKGHRKLLNRNHSNLAETSSNHKGKPVRDLSTSPGQDNGVEPDHHGRSSVTDNAHDRPTQRSQDQPRLTNGTEHRVPSQPSLPAISRMSQGVINEDNIRESSLSNGFGRLTRSSVLANSPRGQTDATSLPDDETPHADGSERGSDSDGESQSATPTPSAPHNEAHNDKNIAEEPHQSSSDSESSAETDSGKLISREVKRTLPSIRAQENPPTTSSRLSPPHTSEGSEGSRSRSPTEENQGQPTAVGRSNSILVNGASSHTNDARQGKGHDAEQTSEAESSESDSTKQNVNSETKQVKSKRSRKQDVPTEKQHSPPARQGRTSLRRSTRIITNGTTSQVTGETPKTQSEMGNRDSQKKTNLEQSDASSSMEEKIRLHSEQMLAKQARIEMLARDGERALEAERARMKKQKTATAMSNGWTNGHANTAEGLPGSTRGKPRGPPKQIPKTPAEQFRERHFGENSARRTSTSVDRQSGPLSTGFNRVAPAQSLSSQKSTFAMQPSVSNGRKRSLTPLIPGAASVRPLRKTNDLTSPLDMKTTRNKGQHGGNPSQAPVSGLRTSVSSAGNSGLQASPEMEESQALKKERSNSSSVGQSGSRSALSSLNLAQSVSLVDEGERATERSTSATTDESHSSKQENTPPQEDEDDRASSYLEEDVGWGAPTTASQAKREATESTDRPSEDAISNTKSESPLESRAQGMNGTAKQSASKTPTKNTGGKGIAQVKRNVKNAPITTITSGSSSESETDSQSTYIPSDEEASCDESEDHVPIKRSQSAEKKPSRSTTKDAKSTRSSASRVSDAPTTTVPTTKKNPSSKQDKRSPSHDSDKTATPPPPSSQPNPPASQPATTTTTMTTAKPPLSRSASKTKWKYPTISSLHAAAEGRHPTHNTITPPSPPASSSQPKTTINSIKTSSQSQSQSQQQSKTKIKNEETESDSDDDSSDSDDSSEDGNSNGEGGGWGKVPKRTPKGSQIIPGMNALFKRMSARPR